MYHHQLHERFYLSHASTHAVWADQRQRHQITLFFTDGYLTSCVMTLNPGIWRFGFSQPSAMSSMSSII